MLRSEANGANNFLFFISGFVQECNLFYPYFTFLKYASYFAKVTYFQQKYR